jgi:hypothetical protein
LISLYRGETPGITVMALSGPFQAGTVKQSPLALTWQTVGASPKSYDVQLDGATVAKGIEGDKYSLDLSRLQPGKHQVTLLANGVHTVFDLNPEVPTAKSATPLPVTSTIEFNYSPDSK